VKILPKEEVVMDAESIEIVANHVRAALAKREREEGIDVAALANVIDEHISRIVQESQARTSQPRRHSDGEISEIVEGALDEVTRDPQQGLSVIFRELYRRKQQ
jgi:hypothetical protein